MPNRLAVEASPYLLQHAENPVDWHPWSDEAFGRARREDKPIFLSIGYSTCHWCHVMEHESFEDPDIAAVLNEHFVPIKVDREERPDVDRVYMTFVQATTGSGGWPMSVWLTPDLKPFYGGTYFPPSARWGRPGFREILQEIARVWQTQREKVVESADGLSAQLRELQADRSAGAPAAGRQAIDEAVDEFARAFDRRHGGFGQAPKFPRPSELLFLLRAARMGNERAGEMAVASLGAMARGGLRDHVGGGFHRYSVDAEWRVPHFEKMLYDQAQLVLAYLEGAQATDGRDRAFFAAVAAETLAYVQREMTGREGAFYSAEDADSLPPEAAGTSGAHKAEGAFYIWSESELLSLAGDDADVARLRFGTEPTGNAPADPHGEFAGKNLLYLARSVEDVARLTGRTGADVEATLERLRAAMFQARSARPRPHLDDKVLTAWNGLMIAAFARAARVLDAAAGTRAGERTAGYLASARSAVRFIREALWDRDRRVLLRRYRAGQAAIDGYAEDYAFLIWGLLELFQADGDPAWLEWALDLQRRQDELFWDAAGSGWFSTTGEDPSVLLRLKEEYDGAEPAAGSVSALNLLTIAHLTGEADASARVERLLGRYGPAVGRAARVLPFMMCAVAARVHGFAQVVIVGDRRAEDAQALLEVVGRRYLPFALVVPVEPGPQQARLAERLPFIGPMTAREGRATAYVCRDFTCEAPVTSADALAGALA